MTDGPTPQRMIEVSLAVYVTGHDGCKKTSDVGNTGSIEIHPRLLIDMDEGLAATTLAVQQLLSDVQQGSERMAAQLYGQLKRLPLVEGER